MKRVLKLCIVAVVLVLGVSSCMKEDDSVNFYVESSYILQTDYGQFIPQGRLAGELLTSASISVEGKTFKFENLNDYVWELPNNSLFELESIALGSYIVTATRSDEKVGTLSIGYSEAEKKIGEISASIENSSTDEELSITFDALVDNAKDYYLMVRTRISETSTKNTMWIPYAKLAKIKDDVLSDKVSYSNLLAGTYEFAVSAGYGSVVKVSRMIIPVTIEE